MWSDYFLFFFILEKKIIVIRLDKMLSWVESKNWPFSYHTSFENLFQLDPMSNFDSIPIVIQFWIIYRQEFNFKDNFLKKHLIWNLKEVMESYWNKLFNEVKYDLIKKFFKKISFFLVTLTYSYHQKFHNFW